MTFSKRTAAMPTKPYDSPSIDDEDTNALALTIVQILDGLPITSARLVLRRAEFWIDATQVVDCSSTECRRATEALLVASPE